MKRHLKQSESGAVAILSVIFFMILLSVLVVSFVRIVVRETQQTTNNELSASALAAAQGGVEDAKRVLVYCATTTDPIAQSECKNALNNNSSCNAITDKNANPTIVAEVPLNVEQRAGSDAWEGVIDNAASQYQQRYSCLQINTITDSVDGIQVVPGKSELIPLKMTGSGTTVPSMTLRWHAKASDLDGAPGDYCPTDTINALPVDTKWVQGGAGSSGCVASAANNGLALPAVMRVEVVTVPKGGFNLDDIANNSRAVTLVPERKTSYISSVVDLNAFTQWTEANKNSTPPIYFAYCSSTSTGSYACEFTFSVGSAFDIGSNDYYLRLSAQYRPAHIQLVPGGGYKFDNVQPKVDVTGRTNDTFRRLEARVRLDAGGTFVPEYAIESGSRVCKNMFITNDNDTTADKCTTYLNANE